MGKFIISEEEKNSIRQMYNLNEQDQAAIETKYIQEFLNKRLGTNIATDGLAGTKTEEAISKYQSMIGVSPADGIWGPDTMSKMPEKDKAMLNDISSGIFGKILNRLF